MESQKNAAPPKGAFRKFGLLDKLSYAAGDFGCNASFGMKSLLSLYWTQMMGIDEILFAALLVVVQVWDGINDPILGAIIDADHRHYKRNKFLTYISFGSMGLIIGSGLCFIPLPNASQLVKCILFVGGYLVWDAFYTVANVPYGSMLSLITDDPAQRSSLSTWRSVGAIVAVMGISVLLPILCVDPVTNNLRHPNVLFFLAIGLAAVGFLFFQFMVHTTQLRAVPVESDAPTVKKPKEKFDVVKAVKNFFCNRAMVGITVAAFGAFMCTYGAQTALTVTFQAYFKSAQFSGLVGVASLVGIIVMAPFSSKIAAKIGKKEVAVLGSALTTIVYASLFVIPLSPDVNGSLVLALVLFIASFGNGLSSCLMWAMVADALDYEEWKFGTRTEGTSYALYSLMRKVAQGVMPSLGLVVATFFGYKAVLGADQAPGVAVAMRYLMPAFYVVGALLSLVGYAWIYNLDRKTMAKMTADLEARRAENA